MRSFSLMVCIFSAIAWIAISSGSDSSDVLSVVTMAPGGSMEAMTKSSRKGEKNDGLMRRDSAPEQQQHFAAIEAHDHLDVSASTTDAPPALNEVRDAHTTSTQNHFAAPTSSPPYDPMGAEDGHWVSCGGHRAPRCRVCTVINPETGKPFEDGLDKGPDWCRGNCKWYEGECQSNSRFTEHIEHNNGSATSGVHATTALPNLLNPELTDTDEEMMHMAAARAIDEADYEARQREANQVKEEDEDKDKLNKFVKLAICTFAACLCCCAIGAVFAVVRYARQGKKKDELLAQAMPEPVLTGADFAGESVQ